MAVTVLPASCSRRCAGTRYLGGHLPHVYGTDRRSKGGKTLRSPSEVKGKPPCRARLRSTDIELSQENGRWTWPMDSSMFETSKERRAKLKEKYPFDVVIVGAGASGVGMGIMLTRTFNLDEERVLIVERGSRVGETFQKWPKEMRFISPSFNCQGWTNSFDLNSVAYGTSPAYTLQAEHPTGQDYAHYLNTLAVNAQLNIKFNTEVAALTKTSEGGFAVDIQPARERNKKNAQGQYAGKNENGHTTSPASSAGEGEEEDISTTTLKSRYVIWAAGEFQFPRAEEKLLFPGAELCRHNSTVESWKGLEGNDFVVIGGYESGMDAMYNLTSSGKHCTVVSSTDFWRVSTADPSTELAPYTMERVRQAFRQTTPSSNQSPPRLLAPLRVIKVEIDKEAEGGGFVVHAKWEAPVKHPGGEHRDREKFFSDDFEEIGEVGTTIQLRTPQPPLLCTGFAGSARLGAAKDLFEWEEEKEGEGGSGCMAGAPLINNVDESTKTPGLFLVGPAVRHGEHIFCFVYKFRQRFGVVADAIARGLGHETTQAVYACRQMNMFLDDFSCCKGACGECGETPSASAALPKIEMVLEERAQKVRLVIFSVLLALYTIVFLKFTHWV